MCCSLIQRGNPAHSVLGQLAKPKRCLACDKAAICNIEGVKTDYGFGPRSRHPAYSRHVGWGQSHHLAPQQTNTVTRIELSVFFSTGVHRIALKPGEPIRSLRGNTSRRWPSGLPARPRAIGDQPPLLHGQCREEVQREWISIAPKFSDNEGHALHQPRRTRHPAIGGPASRPVRSTWRVWRRRGRLRAAAGNRARRAFARFGFNVLSDDGDAVSLVEPGVMMPVGLANSSLDTVPALQCGISRGAPQAASRREVERRHNPTIG
jgi:hypothetical protein